MSNKRRSAIFLLGSNLANRKANIKKAMQLLQANIATASKISDIFETEAWGDKKLLPFLNCACEIKTQRSISNLLAICKQIEANMGRQITKNKKYENRIIDIDIIFCGNEIINTEDITIPHPRFKQRMFAIIPVLQIAPHFMYPGKLETVTDIYLQCKDESEVKLI